MPLETTFPSRSAQDARKVLSRRLICSCRPLIDTRRYADQSSEPDTRIKMWAQDRGPSRLFFRQVIPKLRWIAVVTARTMKSLPKRARQWGCNRLIHICSPYGWRSRHSARRRSLARCLAHPLDHAISENVYAGNAMNRRMFFQYGVLLPANPFGHVDQALSKNVAAGSRPERTSQGQAEVGCVWPIRDMRRYSPGEIVRPFNSRSSYDILKLKFQFNATPFFWHGAK